MLLASRGVGKRLLARSLMTDTPGKASSALTASSSAAWDPRRAGQGGTGERVPALAAARASTQCGQGSAGERVPALAGVTSRSWWRLSVCTAIPPARKRAGEASKLRETQAGLSRLLPHPVAPLQPHNT